LPNTQIVASAAAMSRQQPKIISLVVCISMIDNGQKILFSLPAPIVTAFRETVKSFSAC
jgi:hypothetical protein